MAYMHIDNLYKYPEFLDMFKYVYAMEKIHGTSAYISYKDGRIGYFAGGGNYEIFVALFNEWKLKQVLDGIIGEKLSCHVYGEYYGGKLQGMSHVYGKESRFVAFEVKIGDTWLSVPEAELFVNELGLEFVDYRLIPCTLEELDYQRDRPSVQAMRA